MSALFRMILILSSCDRIASMACLNSSEMSSLCASKTKIILKEEPCCNCDQGKVYFFTCRLFPQTTWGPRWSHSLCSGSASRQRGCLFLVFFIPIQVSGSVNVNEMIPGVSRRVTLFKTGLLVVEHWNLTKDQCWSMPLFSPGEEGSPVVLEMCVRFLCVNSQHIARDVPIIFCHYGRLEYSDLKSFCTILYHLTCVVDHMEGVRRWLGTDSHAREILLQNISVTDIICRGACRHWKGILPFTFTTTSKRHIWVDKLQKKQNSLANNECVPDLKWKCFFLLEPPPPPTLWMWSCQLSIGPSPSPGASPQSLDPPALACGSHGSCTPVAFYRRFFQPCFHLVTFSSGKRRCL